MGSQEPVTLAVQCQGTLLDVPGVGVLRGTAGRLAAAAATRGIQSTPASERRKWLPGWRPMFYPAGLEQQPQVPLELALCSLLCWGGGAAALPLALLLPTMQGRLERGSEEEVL